jgi:hypothetical protein
VAEREGCAVDGGVMAVCDEPGLGVLLADLLDRERAHAVVGVAPSLDEEPVIAPPDVRAVVGERTPIYVLEGEFVLGRLKEELGSRLALAFDAVRVWWPDLSLRSDPGDHPLVVALEGEDEADTLAEFARQFDLSRPHVRREIALLEDCLALAEHNLQLATAQNAKTAERLRDAHRERHREAMRAEKVLGCEGPDGAARASGQTC